MMVGLRLRVGRGLGLGNWEFVRGLCMDLDDAEDTRRAKRGEEGINKY